MAKKGASARNFKKLPNAAVHLGGENIPLLTPSGENHFSGALVTDPAGAGVRVIFSPWISGALGSRDLEVARS